MKGRFFLVAVCLCAAILPLGAGAQPPDLLRGYRFLPRHSTLSVSGGFAGLDLDLPIFGRFGFVTGFHSDSPSPLPVLQPFARFVNVEAEAINPADFGPYSFDIDETLNLSGLRGRPGPLALPLPNWSFEGVDGQEAPMSLLAIEVGRWLVMFGHNEAPCCDFFDYEIRAVARQVPFADFDDDGDSDRDDFSRLVANFGADGGALLEHGDTDVDGDVDGHDFLNVQRDYGDTADTALALATSALANISTVPEPSSCALLLIAASVFIGRLPLVKPRRRKV
jgi:hypothetical protein